METTFTTILGEITATSKKQGEFENGLFSAYISFKDEKQRKKAEDFGLPIYKSKDGDVFTIVQTSRKGVKVYDRDGDGIEVVAGEVKTDGEENPNFKTAGLSGLKLSTGVNKGNKYFRLYGVVGSVENVQGNALEGLDESDLDEIDFTELPF